MERTLIILKPDAVQRGLMGRILQRFEEKGLKVVAARFQRLPETLLEQHYASHKGKPFYPGLVRFMSESPVLVMVLEAVIGVPLVVALAFAFSLVFERPFRSSSTPAVPAGSSGD